jgi:hypothetical protein
VRLGDRGILVILGAGFRQDRFADYGAALLGGTVVVAVQLALVPDRDLDPALFLF